MYYNYIVENGEEAVSMGEMRRKDRELRLSILPT